MASAWLRRGAALSAVGAGALVASGLVLGPPPRASLQRRPTPAGTPAAGDAQREVRTRLLVVGGGIAGASLAFHAGATLSGVMLLDRGFVGGEASGLSAGTLDNGGARGSGASLLSRLRTGSSRVIRGLQAAGFDCEYVQSGALVVAVDDGQAAYLRERYAAIKDHEDVQLLDGAAQVVAVEPALAGGSCVAALHSPQSGHVNPSATTHAFVEAAAARNVHVVVKEGAEVTAVERLPEGGYRVRTRNGMVIRCEALAMCAGAWSDALGRLLGIQVPVVPVKGQIWVTEPVPQSYLSKVIFIAESGMAFHSTPGPEGLPRFCTHDQERRQHVRHAYGRHLPDGRIIFGGDRVPCPPKATHEDLYGVDDDYIARNQRHVYEFLPSLKQFQVDGAWAGPMPFSMDGLPIVGELDTLGFPDLWILSGLGPHGIMEAPEVSRLVAQRITRRLLKEAAPEPEPLDVDLADKMLEAFAPARPGCVTKVAPEASGLLLSTASK